MIHTAQDVLNCPMGENSSGQSTIRGYLIALLVELWHEKDCFSGKRPFGEKHWDYEITLALVKGGFLEGVWDDHSCLVRADRQEINMLVLAAINELGRERG
jgi:hypothetical protein